MGLHSHSRNKKCLRVVAIFLCISFIGAFYFLNKGVEVRKFGRKDALENKPSLNMLDGCYHVYIDVGTNIGVQIRKLFEPEKYPKAYVHPIFDSKFGNITERLKFTPDGGNTVCAVGFEPNPHHTSYLKEVESSYSKCGWRVKIMTETAASDKNGRTTFYSDESYKNMEWGGGVLPPHINSIAVEQKDNTAMQDFTNVALVRLSDFLKHTVATRKLPFVPPSNSISPNVVMKMDIEGSEVDVIPDLLFTGGLQFINNIVVEWHERLEKIINRRNAQQQLKLVIQTLSKYSETMKNHGAKFDFNLINLDDETYYTSKFDLPKC